MDVKVEEAAEPAPNCAPSDSLTVVLEISSEQQQNRNERRRGLLY